MKASIRLDLNESCNACKLGCADLFCNLPPQWLRPLHAIKHTSMYPEGAVLFMEEQTPQGILVLCKGRVKLSMTSAGGRTVILRIVRAGEILGLQAVVSGEPFQVTAETLEPCRINFINREEFLRFLRGHAEASIRVAKQLGSDYHIACELIRSMVLSRSVPRKLAKFLLEWSNHEQEVKTGTRTKLTLTHEEIGHIIGSTRETVTRALADLKSRQLAALTGSTLVIRNKAGLEQVANA
ncbi:MAG TPA: Crp/Fnr family transcriptional regulator [Terriglobia bacterium]|nr:Crp/Fnr family transcriptional regulator [Terriglobia bacterium]